MYIYEMFSFTVFVIKVLTKMFFQFYFNFTSSFL